MALLQEEEEDHVNWEAPPANTHTYIHTYTSTSSCPRERTRPQRHAYSRQAGCLQRTNAMLRRTDGRMDRLFEQVRSLLRRPPRAPGTLFSLSLLSFHFPFLLLFPLFLFLFCKSRRDFPILLSTRSTAENERKKKERAHTKRKAPTKLKKTNRETEDPIEQKKKREQETKAPKRPKRTKRTKALSAYIHTYIHTHTYIRRAHQKPQEPVHGQRLEAGSMRCTATSSAAPPLSPAPRARQPASHVHSRLNSFIRAAAPGHRSRDRQREGARARASEAGLHVASPPAPAEGAHSPPAPTHRALTTASTGSRGAWRAFVLTRLASVLAAFNYVRMYVWLVLMVVVCFSLFLFLFLRLLLV